jgi:hypothetical protein
MAGSCAGVPFVFAQSRFWNGIILDQVDDAVVEEDHPVLTVRGGPFLEARSRLFSGRLLVLRVVFIGIIAVPVHFLAPQRLACIRSQEKKNRPFQGRPLLPPN